MGACFDCLVEIAGTNRQACMTEVRAGMVVRRMAGARDGQADVAGARQLLGEPRRQGVVVQQLLGLHARGRLGEAEGEHQPLGQDVVTTLQGVRDGRGHAFRQELLASRSPAVAAKRVFDGELRRPPKVVPRHADMISQLL